MKYIVNTNMFCGASNTPPANLLPLLDVGGLKVVQYLSWLDFMVRPIWWDERIIPAVHCGKWLGHGHHENRVLPDTRWRNLIVAAASRENNRVCIDFEYAQWRHEGRPLPTQHGNLHVLSGNFRIASEARRTLPKNFPTTVLHWGMYAPGATLDEEQALFADNPAVHVVHCYAHHVDIAGRPRWNLLYNKHTTVDEWWNQQTHHDTALYMEDGGDYPQLLWQPALQRLAEMTGVAQ